MSIIHSFTLYVSKFSRRSVGTETDGSLVCYELRVWVFATTTMRVCVWQIYRSHTLSHTLTVLWWNELYCGMVGAWHTRTHILTVYIHAFHMYAISKCSVFGERFELKLIFFYYSFQFTDIDLQSFGERPRLDIASRKTDAFESSSTIIWIRSEIELETANWWRTKIKKKLKRRWNVFDLPIQWRKAIQHTHTQHQTIRLQLQ